MKTVNEDPHAFYEDGGWEFLTGGSDVSRLDRRIGVEQWLTHTG